MGRIATILFAHRLGTALEPECKMYRLAADVFNDAAMILDCLSPALPKTSRVVLLSFSSVLRALCGVAAGSSKASLSAHFATQGNLGELNAVSLMLFFLSCDVIGWSEEKCIDDVKERFQPRNNHLPPRHASRKSRRLDNLLAMGDLERYDRPPSHPSRDELSRCESS
jgi:hypothetical protein